MGGIFVEDFHNDGSLFFVSESDAVTQCGQTILSEFNQLLYSMCIYKSSVSNKYLYCRYDDSTVNQVTDAQVLKPKPPRMPYLLMYRRHDTLPVPHRATGKPEWVLPHRLTDSLPTAGFLSVPNIRPMFRMYHSITQSFLWNAQSSMVPRRHTSGHVPHLENEFVNYRLHIYTRFCQKQYVYRKV